MRHPITAILALAVALGATPAGAESIRTIDAPRILVSDVAPGQEGAPGGDVELGPAPPPGGSRLIERREVMERLIESGADPKKLVMPAVVRVLRAARRMSPTDLEAETEPVLRGTLPPGVTLSALRFARGVVLPPHATVKKALIPKIPHRAGSLHVTVMFEYVENAEVVLRVPGTVTVEVSEKAAEPSVVRGARLDIVIEKGPARVSAVGFALSDADIGDIISIRVDSTQKILEARVESSQKAVVVRP